MTQNQETYDYLKSINCCNICCLRYLNGRGDDYVKIEDAFKAVSIFFFKFIKKNLFFKICLIFSGKLFPKKTKQQIHVLPA